MVTNETKSVIIVEPNHEGHRLRYVGQLAAAYLEKHPSGPVHLVTTPAAVHSGEYFEHLSSRQLAVNTHLTSGSIFKQLETAIKLSESSRSRIVLPDGDQFIIPLLLAMMKNRPKKITVGLLVMRTDPLSFDPRKTAKQLAKRCCAMAVSMLPAVNTFFLTDSFGVVTSRPGYKALQPLQDPEPHTSEEIRDHHETWTPSRQRVISIIGRVTTRKNPHLLLNYAQNNDEVEIVLAGKIDTDLPANVHHLPNLTLINRLMANSELDYIAKKSHILFLIYDNDAPSGILATAVRCGTPVIVRRGTWLDNVVRTLGIGESADREDGSVQAAADRIFANHKQYVEQCIKARDLLTVDQFTSALLGDAGSTNSERA